MGRSQSPQAQRFSRAVAAELRGTMASRTPRINGQDLAEDVTGRSQNYIAIRLRGERPFTLDELDSICTFLRVDSAALIRKVNDSLKREGEENDHQ